MRAIASIASLLLCFVPAVQSAVGPEANDVRRFGANGDAVQTTANTFAGTNFVQLHSADALPPGIGPLVIFLSGVGAPTTNGWHEDLIARIQRVEHGTNVWMATSAWVSAEADCTIGTDNARAFQAAIDASLGQTNVAVYVPPGKYLMIPTGIWGRSNAQAFAVIVTNSVRVCGSSPDRTILLGNGAWQRCGTGALTCQRGSLFAIKGPMPSNSAQVIFENLSFDGGVRVGMLTNKSESGFAPNAWPASKVDGWGWDWTHGSHLDCGKPPLPALQVFSNCRFRHWRGEVLKSVAPLTDGYIVVADCQFEDNNASAFNFSFTHRIERCTFTKTRMAMEFYMGYSQGTSCFINNACTGMSRGIVIVGAETRNRVSAYVVASNQFDLLPGGIAIQASGARNLTVTGNRFEGGSAGFCVTAAGYQGTDFNRHFLIEANTFTNTHYPVMLNGNGRNRTAGVVVRSNTAVGSHVFMCGDGWCTNVVVSGNRGDSTLNGTTLHGQWFYDDGSNALPPYQTRFTSKARTTETLTYAHGAYQSVYSTLLTNITCLLDATAAKIPRHAHLKITLKLRAPYSASFYSENRLLATDVPSGGFMDFRWDGREWVRD